MTWQKALFTGFMSFSAGTLLGIYTLLAGPVKFIFSMGALGVAFYFFKKYDTKGIRIAFVVLSFLYALLFVFLATAVIYMTNMPQPS
ncbi:hypothetical protein [Paenibacillus marinisediminis]